MHHLTARHTESFFTGSRKLHRTRLAGIRQCHTTSNTPFPSFANLGREYERITHIMSQYERKQQKQTSQNSLTRPITAGARQPIGCLKKHSYSNEEKSNIKWCWTKCEKFRLKNEHWHQTCTSPVLQKQITGAEKKHTRQVVLAYWWQICQYEHNRAAVIKSISEWENVN